MRNVSKLIEKLPRMIQGIVYRAQIQYTWNIVTHESRLMVYCVLQRGLKRSIPISHNRDTPALAQKTPLRTRWLIPTKVGTVSSS